MDRCLGRDAGERAHDGDRVGCIVLQRIADGELARGIEQRAGVSHGEARLNDAGARGRSVLGSRRLGSERAIDGGGARPVARVLVETAERLARVVTHREFRVARPEARQADAPSQDVLRQFLRGGEVEEPVLLHGATFKRERAELLERIWRVLAVESFEPGHERGPRLRQIGRRFRLRRCVVLGRLRPLAHDQPDAGHEEWNDDQERDGGDDPAAAGLHSTGPLCEKRAATGPERSRRRLPGSARARRRSSSTTSARPRRCARRTSGGCGRCLPSAVRRGPCSSVPDRLSTRCRA